MASRVVMPKLTDTMEEGVVVAWKKQEGDAVSSGDALAEIETDKAVMDLEAFASGTLRRVLVREGETVKAGALLAVIGEADEDIAPALQDSIEAAPSTSAPQRTPTPAATPTAQQRGHVVAASPRARTLAATRGIDLSGIHGSGPGGRIVERDVMEFAQAPPPEPGATDRPLSQMRKAIARAMVQSKAPVPHFYVSVDIAMEGAERFREGLKRARQPHPSVTALLIKAAALTLARHPHVNASFIGDAIREHPSIDIGVAVALEDGLITPVVRDCARKSLEQIAEESRDLIERARERRLKPPEYTGATFSISNLGMYDVDEFVAVLTPPEAASLAVGRIRDVPVVQDGTVAAGRRMIVTLSCDHRVLDGAQGARFLKDFKKALEHPEELTAV